MISKTRSVLCLGVALLLPIFATAYAKSGYPYTTGSGTDPWGFYKRQCTSYAAWSVNDDGIEMSNTMEGPNDVSGRFGNGGNWDNNATAIGLKVDNKPMPGDVGVLDPYQGGAGSAGHVVYVESVNNDETVNISEYNWSGTEKYGERSNISLNHYIHFNACVPPGTGDWLIERNCTLNDAIKFSKNIRVKSNSTMTITDTGILDADLANKNLTIESGSKVLIKNGGKIH